MRSFAAAALLAIVSSVVAVPPTGTYDTQSLAPPASHSDARLNPRADNARFTYYATGVGACGKENKDSDFIVAVNTDVSTCLSRLVPLLMFYLDSNTKEENTASKALSSLTTANQLKHRS